MTTPEERIHAFLQASERGEEIAYADYGKVELRYSDIAGADMVKYELPAEPELHSTVRDNQGERYVGLNNDKGFQRWYFIRNPEGVNVKSETPNWTWAELLNAFGPVELVEKMVRKIDASCVHCGSWIKAEAQALHSAWHDNLADTVHRQQTSIGILGAGLNDAAGKIDGQQRRED